MGWWQYSCIATYSPIRLYLQPYTLKPVTYSDFPSTGANAHCAQLVASAKGSCRSTWCHRTTTTAAYNAKLSQPMHQSINSSASVLQMCNYREAHAHINESFAALSPIFSMQEESRDVSNSVSAVFHHINECVVIINIIVHDDDRNCSRFFCDYCLGQKRAVAETQVYSH